MEVFIVVSSWKYIVCGFGGGHHLNIREMLRKVYVGRHRNINIFTNDKADSR